MVGQKDKLYSYTTAPIATRMNEKVSEKRDERQRKRQRKGGRREREIEITYFS